MASRVKYTLSDVRMRLPSAGKTEVEGSPVTFPITTHAYLTAKGRRALDALARRGELLQYDDYTFPRVFRKGGYAISTGDPNQKSYEELRSVLEGSWTFGVPNSAAKIAEKKLLAMGQEDAEELAPLLVSAANRYQREHFLGTHSAKTMDAEFKHMTGLVEMALHGESAKLARLGWGPGWSGVIDSRTGFAKDVDDNLLPDKQAKTLRKRAKRVGQPRRTPTSLGGMR